MLSILYFEWYPKGAGSWKKTWINDIFEQDKWESGFPRLRHNPLSKLPIWYSYKPSDPISNIYNFLVIGPIYFAILFILLFCFHMNELITRVITAL